MTEVVVITGASAGVGRAVVREFARDGAAIGLLARGREGLEGARREVEAAGGRALAVPTDVADAQQVEAAAARVESDFGSIGVWVNDAMTTVYSPFTDMTAAEFRRVTEVTYLGAVYGTMAALRRMVPRDRGVVVQVGSALGYRAIPLQSAYCGAKHALRGFSDGVRSELIHDGSQVRISMVQLAAFNTPQFDWGRNRLPERPRPVPPIFQPEIAARAVHRMAHRPRREVWVGGPALQIILASRLAQSWLGRKLAYQAWDGQFSGEPAEPRPDNLHDPVTGDYGAHGRFDARARRRSLQTWASLHRGPLATGGLLLGAAAVAAGAALRRRGPALPRP